MLLFLLVSLTTSLFGADTQISLDYYGEIGCAHCDLFVEKILPEAERETGIAVTPNLIDILSEAGYEKCEAELESRGLEFTIFPVLVIGNNVYQGNSAVEENLIEELRYFSEHGRFRDTQEAADVPYEGAAPRLQFLPVLAAGLVDGINPCAFTTMLFFISWIALKGGSRHTMLIVGISFIAGIFLSYLAIGFGLFAIIRTASASYLFRAAVKYLFAAVALMFAVLSLRDARTAAQGKASDTLLQLPKSLKRSIHKVIRENRTFGPLVVISCLISGILVSLLELACTGQVYFPTLAYMVQSSDGAAGSIFLLILYNLAFIAPLLVLLGLSVAGVEHKRLQMWYKNHLAAGRILMALFFFCIAALLLLTG